MVKRKPFSYYCICCGVELRRDGSNRSDDIRNCCVACARSLGR